MIKATKVDKRNKFSGNVLLEFIINHFESHPHPSVKEIRRYTTHLIQVTFPSPSEIKHLLSSFDIKKVLEVDKIPYKGGFLYIRYFKKSVFLDKAETKIIYTIEKRTCRKCKIFINRPANVLDTFFGMCQIVLRSPSCNFALHYRVRFFLLIGKDTVTNILLIEEW